MTRLALPGVTLFAALVAFGVVTGAASGLLGVGGLLGALGGGGGGGLGGGVSALLGGLGSILPF